MANSYETITVLTHIPGAAMDALSRAVLEHLGFGTDDGDDKGLYLYAEDPSGYIDEDGLTEIISGLGAPSCGNGLIEELKQQPDDCWINVLQHLLQGQAMAGIPHIDLMASQTCSKARPWEHGGWSMRISRDRIQHASTADAFRDWDGVDQRIGDMANLCDALSNRSDLTKAQRESLARVVDSVAHHPAIEYSEEAQPCA